MTRSLGSALGLCLCLLASACGGGGGGGGGGASVDPAVLLAPAAAPSADEVQYFLTRTSFAATPTLTAEVAAMGFDAYVDAMVEWTDDAAADAAARAALNTSRTAAPTRNPDNARAIGSQNEVVRYWLGLIQQTRTPFRERLALHWHDRFATSVGALDGQSYYLFLEHMDLVRSRANGNLKELIYELSTDPTMLIWLSGTDSRRGAPNENFARELWELFTLGVDNGYTQADIEEAAKCFTGFRRRTDVSNPSAPFGYVAFDPARHDTTTKTIFGRTVAGRTTNDFGPGGQNEYRDVVELTFAERPVAEFLVRGLFEDFCFRPAPEGVVAALAQELRDAGYELKPLLKRLLKSRAMFDARARAGQVKSPVEMAMGFVRATGLTLTAQSLQTRLTALGQVPAQPPVVAGWPEGSLWLTADSMVDRANLVREAIARRTLDVTPLLPPSGARTAEATVAALAARLGVKLSAEDATDCVEYLNTDRNGSGVVVSNPWDGEDATQVSKKARGLLYILSQHPTYHVR